MKRLILLCFSLLLVVSCGYHLGGLKRTSMQDMDTFCVDMFANNTVFPNVSMQLTTALTDNMQRDGTYRLASPASSDFTISGAVTSVNASSLRTNSSDTYLSSEIGLTVNVAYRVVNNRTGQTLYTSTVRAEGSYFNDNSNAQTARDTALSYATRRAAELIVQALTTP